MRKGQVLLFLTSFMSTFISFDENIAGPVSGSNAETIRAAKTHSNIMLVLGSAEPDTRAKRIVLACDLLKRGDIHFDKVILSGGCGAHGSDKFNCEATDMKALMETTCADNISGLVIYKEENSRSTIQNYCYSSALENQGQKLIQRQDTVYVVSSHYHALSVAACFGNDGVDAHYHYTCGDRLYDGLAPALATVVGSTAPCYRDYTGIAQRCGTPDWCGSQRSPK